MIFLEDIQRRIIELEIEHRDLNAVIDALILDVRHDELQLRRLKKRKLQLKDYITLLKMQLIPDVPAYACISSPIVSPAGILRHLFNCNSLFPLAAKKASVISVLTFESF